MMRRLAPLYTAWDRMMNNSVLFSLFLRTLAQFVGKVAQPTTYLLTSTPFSRLLLGSTPIEQGWTKTNGVYVPLWTKVHEASTVRKELLFCNAKKIA